MSWHMHLLLIFMYYLRPGDPGIIHTLLLEKGLPVC